MLGRPKHNGDADCCQALGLVRTFPFMLNTSNEIWLVFSHLFFFFLPPYSFRTIVNCKLQSRVSVCLAVVQCCFPSFLLSLNSSGTFVSYVSLYMWHIGDDPNISPRSFLRTQTVTYCTLKSLTHISRIPHECRRKHLYAAFGSFSYRFMWRGVEFITPLCFYKAAFKLLIILFTPGISLESDHQSIRIQLCSLSSDQSENNAFADNRNKPRRHVTEAGWVFRTMLVNHYLSWDICNVNEQVKWKQASL